MNKIHLPTLRHAAPIETTLTGSHVLAAVVVFFGVVFAVNGVLLFKSLSTHSGLVANEPYRKGLAYNERIAADERQLQLGWRDTVEVDAAGRVHVAFEDRMGSPVIGLAVEAVLGRPPTVGHDARLDLSETAPGHYTAVATSLAAGTWLLSVEARAAAPGTASDAQPIYRLRKRLWVKP